MQITSIIPLKVLVEPPETSIRYSNVYSDGEPPKILNLYIETNIVLHSILELGVSHPEISNS